jgi:hypothetical protein
MARLVARWVRIYTRGLPAPVAERRVDEIKADGHDHIEHARAGGTGDRRIALSLASRMIRGAAADTAWRKRHSRGHRALVRVAVAVAFILALPLAAMQFTAEVSWSAADFAVAGVLLVATGLLLELAARKAGAYRAAAVVAVVAALLLVWINLAVGIIGEPGEPANAMYAGVLAVGIAGVVVARLRPRGMSRALLVTALAQALVAVIALLAGKAQSPVSSVSEIVALNGMFVALFAGSAWLFRHAASTAR